MKLKEIRESRGISQRQAAIALNLSPTVYNRYENGLREPSNVIMLAMADYFGVSVDELLGRAVEQPPDDDAWAIRERLRRMPFVVCKTVCKTNKKRTPPKRGMDYSI